MIVEIGALQSDDDAAMWAHRSLSLTNTLTSDDAQQVEASFAANIATFSHDDSLTELGRYPDGKGETTRQADAESTSEEESASTGCYSDLTA